MARNGQKLSRFRRTRHSNQPVPSRKRDISGRKRSHKCRRIRIESSLSPFESTGQILQWNPILFGKRDSHVEEVDERTGRRKNASLFQRADPGMEANDEKTDEYPSSSGKKNIWKLNTHKDH